ncbi:hypothetical protein HCN44_007135 [Aphidius gifuensis]|uniref:Galectin n=1 Tax=Aphidius gifuensis TaxID=684658 RepID=A0A834XP54_APHGI|nr:32 kDa beta-galactoside-binding lectin-like [Aphidius gifuensis]KAF7988825.1 hypothetical protein HCN44_007135 [Aphidius gifuensis]
MEKVKLLWSRTNSGDYPIHELDDGKLKDCVYLQQLKITGQQLPVTKYLNKGFNVGSSLLINGYIHPDVDKLSFNLLINNDDEDDDVALHFNPRFYENEVVRNTYKNEDWGEEERSGGFPLSAGSYFSLKINCEKKGFEFFINGKLFEVYDHRIKPKKITHLELEGAMALDLILYKTIIDEDDMNKSTSSSSSSDSENEDNNIPAPIGFHDAPPPPTTNIMSSIWGETNDGKFLIYDPYCGDINEFFHGIYLQQFKVKNDDDTIKLKFDKKFSPGSSIIINGYSKSDAERFELNLFTKEKINGDKMKNIALHFNPRFTEYEIVRNTYDNDDWGEEERSGGFPLTVDRNYSIKIDCEDKGFRIFIDSKEFTFYNHRLSPDNINKMEIEGETFIHSAFYKTV